MSRVLIHPAKKPALYPNKQNRLISQSDRFANIAFGKKQPEKTYVVVDSFKGPKSTDIDGDGIKDFRHGEMVARFIKAVLPGANIHTIHSGTESENVAGENEVQQKKPSDLKELIAALEEARDYVKKHKVDGLNISVSVDLSFEDAKKYCRGINKDNFTHHRAELLEALESQLPNKPWEKMSVYQRRIYTGVKCARILEDIAREGVEVCIAAGNNGPDNFVLFNLAEGVTPVGSNNIKGRPSAFSARHEGIEFEKGEYVSVRIRENGKLKGYDINDDGVVDIKPEEVSGNGKAQVDQFVGRPLAECKATSTQGLDFIHYKKYLQNKENLLDELIDLICFWKKKPRVEQKAPVKSSVDIEYEKLQQEKLFDIGLAGVAFEFTDKDIERFKIQGEYVHIPTNVLYSKDSEGKVAYNPDGSGRKDMVSTIFGTSYASPVRLVKKTNPGD